MKNLHRTPVFIAYMALILSLSTSITPAAEVRWIAIGSLHSWYSSVGFEIEVGRTGLFNEQQDGLRWPALFKWQDSQVAKGLWIGTTNYQDPTVDKFYSYKVVHVGPRMVDEINTFIPVKFELVAKMNHPTVVVDGLTASHTVYMDKVDRVDANLPADRMLNTVVNTSIGITMTRKIYAFSQQYHDNYFIHDYVYKNTGIYDKNGHVEQKTLTDVIFLYQYRIAISREVGDHGLNYQPQSVDWGHNTLHNALYGDPFRCFYAWHGLFSKVDYDNIGAPYVSGDGHLGAAQFPGVITLYADVSATDKSNDPEQPRNTQFLGSDVPITKIQDDYNAAAMTEEYAFMSLGRPSQTHSEAFAGTYADNGTNGGYSQCIGFGPYDLAPGDSIHVVFAEAVNGLKRSRCYEIGAKWLNAYHNQSVSYDFPMPDGSTITGTYSGGAANEYKDNWTMTGVDSILKTFGRVKDNWESGFEYDPPPPPPNLFTVTSGGDKITLEWSEDAESYEHFGGYKVYRSIHQPDTTFELIYSCGQGTPNPLIRNYEDKTAKRGFDYYYYVTVYDDGTVNSIDPGAPLESNLFWTRTIEPAYLRRPSAEGLANIKIVPNPYAVKAKDYQFGDSAPDRLMFYNLPPVCTIRIFTERGDLIDRIEHNDGSGDEAWNSTNAYKQVVVSGLYIATFETPSGETICKKFIVIR